MSFSRGYPSCGESLSAGRRRRWPSGNGCYGSCAIEAGGDETAPPLKRRKPSSCSSSSYVGQQIWPLSYGNWNMESEVSRGRSELVKLAEDEHPVFVSRDEIERCSPSRKDGIDVYRETRLRYSYCAFLQNLGTQLELPQTTIGTAMVLCHRFFFRRSHACHDRFLIATAALFLASKSEDTPCPLNNVVNVSSEICHMQNSASYPYMLPVDWFNKYRERIIEAEHLILTTLNFELNVQHPFTPLTSILNKLGLSQTVLVNLSWNLINEGVLSIICSCSCVVFFHGGLIAVHSEIFYLQLMLFFVYNYKSFKTCLLTTIFLFLVLLHVKAIVIINFILRRFLLPSLSLYLASSFSVCLNNYLSDFHNLNLNFIFPNPLKT